MYFSLFIGNIDNPTSNRMLKANIKTRNYCYTVSVS